MAKEPYTSTLKEPSHMDWLYRREAFVYSGDVPIRANLEPVGDRLLKWMLRESNDGFLTHAERTRYRSYTNPYTYDSGQLAHMFCSLVNEASAFVTNNKENPDHFEIEIKYVRLASEISLLTARICESLIKQLLFVTDFRPRLYKKSALGQLLSIKCAYCSRANKTHYLSLLGSLAHRFRRCISFDECLHEKMTIVNTERNRYAAHSGVFPLEGVTSQESTDLLSRHLDKVGLELIHMLKHIQDLENLILNELDFNIRFQREAIFTARFYIDDCLVSSDKD